MNSVMLDLETLGTVASSVILSIGAVKFDLDSDAVDDNGFYASISIESNLLAGRQFSESTLLWWLQQDTAAQKVFHEEKQPLEAALASFDEWFGQDRAAGKRLIWSNGADFDLPMLRHAYHLFGWDAPWGPYNGRCVRTYKNLPGAAVVAKPKAGIAHNALHDAINQAQHVQAIHAALFGKKVAA